MISILDVVNSKLLHGESLPDIHQLLLSKNLYQGTIKDFEVFLAENGIDPDGPTLADIDEAWNSEYPDEGDEE